MATIGDFLDAFGFENLLLIATFLVSFALINMVLKRVLKDKYGQPNKTVAGIVGFSVSMLIVYGVHKMGFDLGNFFYDIGISSEILEVLIPLIVLGAVIWLIYKIGITLVIFILGLLLTIISFTEIVYESGTLFIIGVVLLLLSLVIWWIKRKGKPKFEDVASPILKSMTSGSAPSSPIETKQRALEEGYARQLAETQAYAATKEAEAEKAKRIFQRQREIARRQRTQAQSAEELAVAQDAERQASEGIKRAEAEAEQAKKKETEIKQAKTAAQEQRKIIERIEKQLQPRQKRLIEIQKRLQEIKPVLQQGIQEAEQLHNEAGKLGWTKGGLKPIEGENKEQQAARAEKARDVYKAWYRQYSKNTTLSDEKNKLTKEYNKIIKEINKLKFLYSKYYKK